MYGERGKQERRQYIMQELTGLRVQQGRHGECLEDLDYYQLRRLLAVKRATNS